MLLEVLMVATIQGCPVPQKTILDGSKWVRADSQGMDTATKHCKYFYPNLPCLIHFYKIKYQTYHATCGAKRD